MKSNFLSNFFIKGISVISYNYSNVDNLFQLFTSHLSKKSVVIDEDKNIISILEQLKNQSVFISTPTNNWESIIDNNSKEILKRSQRMKRLLQKIMSISQNNNLSIIIKSITYNSINSINTIQASSISYISNFIVNYNGDFNIIKNRYGDNGIVAKSIVYKF